MRVQSHFRSLRHRYWENFDGSKATHARPGSFELPQGGESPAVVIFRDKFFLGILTTEDAVRLSNEIIEAVERPVI
jgi:hypothetical protein